MARKPTLRQVFDKLLARFDPEIRKVFLVSISDIKSRTVLKILIERLDRGDINGALEALNIERTAFARVEDAISQTYSTGGSAMAEYLPAILDTTGSHIVIRFDVRNIRAEQWLKDHSSNLITSIVDEQRNNVRTVLEQGMAQGNNPRTVALDIIGRINPLTQRREGGIVGLTQQQMQFVTNAKDELSSGNAVEMQKYLGRTRRDKRFDSVVRKAIKEDSTLNSATVDKIISRYSDSLLKLRGDTIGRTEALNSLNSSKDEAFQQGLEKAGYSHQSVTKIWRSSGDNRVRHSHSAMNGQKVKGLNSAFVSPFGARMKYPHDRSLGAGPEEIINCRCIVDYRIDFAEGLV